MPDLILNSDLETYGIYRALLLEENRIYVPGLTNFSLSNPDGTINMESYEKNKESLPIGYFCAFSRKCTENDRPASCWVTFECGDVKRPIIMGFQGPSIKSAIEDGGVMYMGGGDESSTGEGNTGEDANNETEGVSNSNGNSSIDNYLNSIGDKTYSKEKGRGEGTQCVELTNDYLEKALGIKNHGGFGNGNAYANNIINKYPDKFSSISPSSGLKVGDILSSESFTGNPAGHVTIVTAVNGNKISYIEQGKNMKYINHGTYTINGNKITNSKGITKEITGVARPK